jgi:hypothetical protein
MQCRTRNKSRRPTIGEKNPGIRCIGCKAGGDDNQQNYAIPHTRPTRRIGGGREAVFHIFSQQGSHATTSRKQLDHYEPEGGKNLSTSPSPRMPLLPSPHPVIGGGQGGAPGFTHLPTRDPHPSQRLRREESVGSRAVTFVSTSVDQRRISHLMSHRPELTQDGEPKSRRGDFK